jgi:SEC-C motif domain protein
MAFEPTEPCPCTSGAPYGACCAPYHRGEREPEDAARLMRSRYAAFCLEETAWLWETLHSSCPDKKRPEQEVRKELLKACRRFKYRGLWILDHAQEGETSLVLFQVKLWEGGRDRSFLEKSKFLREDGAWRYFDGELLAVARVKGDPRALRLSTFDALPGKV